jgi:hypothetical protein
MTAKAIHLAPVPLPISTFRFDADRHDYIETATGVVLPHITGMLERAGWIDDRWYTDESCERGHQVHRLTADVDLGAIEPYDVQGKYRSYVLAYVDAMKIIPHDWQGIEEPLVHPTFRFGGRADRRGRIYTAQGVMEIKSGLVDKAHPIQTALQAILVAPLLGIPSEIVDRFCLYVKPTGRWKLEQHRERRDLIEAQRIIRLCCT